MRDQNDIMRAFYVADPDCITVGTTEAVGGGMDGASMVYVALPKMEVPLLLDPDGAKQLVRKILMAADAAGHKRSALLDDEG